MIVVSNQILKVCSKIFAFHLVNEDLNLKMMITADH